MQEQTTATGARPSYHRVELAESASHRIIAVVAGCRKVPVHLLFHPARCGVKVARTRQLAMYLVHTLLGRTMTDVGQLFGRDRTTVSHACQVIEDLRDDRGFEAELQAIEARIERFLAVTHG